MKEKLLLEFIFLQNGPKRTFMGGSRIFYVSLQEIQSLLINWKGPDLTTYGELVLEGTFHVLRAKNTRTLFLFERMLLITKKRGEHYVYKIHISVWFHAFLFIN